MTFTEMTRVMLNSMDFFELRRTAARYGLAFQGVRRTKLIRDLERTIGAKNAASKAAAQGKVGPSPLNIVPESTPTVKSKKSKKPAMTVNSYRSGNATSSSLK